MGIVAAIEKDINIAETWISSAAKNVERLFQKEAPVAKEAASAIATTVSDVETFLAAATPAVAGEGLNFPADSVAYAAFVKLVGNWQSLAAVVKDAVADAKQ